MEKKGVDELITWYQDHPFERRDCWSIVFKQDEVAFFDWFFKHGHTLPYYFLSLAVDLSSYNIMRGPLREEVIKNGARCLAYASTKAMIRFIVRELGVDPNQFGLVGYQTHPLIFWHCNSRERISAFIECGANVELESSDGMTLLALLCTQTVSTRSAEDIAWFVETHMPNLYPPNWHPIGDQASRFIKIQAEYKARVEKCKRAVLCWMARGAAPGHPTPPNRDVMLMIAKLVWDSRRTEVWTSMQLEGYPGKKRRFM